MGALLGNAAPLHDHHAVGMFDGGQAVCNDQRGAALHQALQRVLHQPFGFGVERRGCFVQNQDGRILVQGPRNGQPLTLSARELCGVVADDGVDALGQSGDMPCQVRGFQAVAHPLFVHRGSQRHIGGNAVVEHDHVLAHHRKLRAQRPQVPVLNGMTIDQDVSLHRCNKTWQKVDECGLARAGWPDKRHDLAGCHFQADLVQGRRVVWPEGDRYPLQRQLAPDPVGAVLAATFGASFAQQGQAALQRRHATRDRAGDIGQAPYGGYEHQHGGDEGGKAPHRDALGIHRPTALPECDADHHRQCGCGQQLGQWRHGCRCNRGFDGQPSQAVAEALKAPGLALLGTVQPDHAVRQHVFFHHIGQFIRGLLAAFGEVVEPLGQRLHDPGHARHHHGHDQRQLPVQVEQVEQQCDQRESVARNPHQRLHEQC